MKEEEPFHPDPHDAEAFRIASLVAAFIHNRLTTAEEQELDEWVGASFENQRLFEQMIDESNHKKWLAEMDGMDVENFGSEEASGELRVVKIAGIEVMSNETQ